MILGEGKKQSSTGEARALCMNGEINLSLSDRPLAFSAPLEKRGNRARCALRSRLISYQVHESRGERAACTRLSVHPRHCSLAQVGAWDEPFRP